MGKAAGGEKRVHTKLGGGHKMYLGVVTVEENQSW